MIRFLAGIVLVFALIYWLPVHQPVGIDFQGVEIKIQLWLLIAAQILLLVVLMLLWRLYRSVMSIPNLWSGLSASRRVSRAARSRDHMLQHLLNGRDDCVWASYELLGSSGTWSDHLVAAVGARKAGEFVHFEQAISQLSEESLSEDTLSMLRICGLSEAGVDDIQTQVLPLLKTEKTRDFAWLWAARNPEQLTELVWFFQRQDAKSTLGQDKYEKLYPYLIKLACKQYSCEQVISYFSRHESKDPWANICLILAMCPHDEVAACAHFQYILGRIDDPRLLSLGVFFLEQEAWRSWFKKRYHTDNRKEVRRLFVLIHLLEGDSSGARDLCRTLMGISHADLGQFTSDCDQRDGFDLLLMAAVDSQQPIGINAISELCRRQVSSQYFPHS